MKIVFITYDGVGLPIALKLQQEGKFEVIVGQVKKLDFIKEEKELYERRLSLYDGLIEKYDAEQLISKLLKENNKDDYFIVCDFNYLYSYAEMLKKNGFRGLLPSKEDYDFEHDRYMAKEFVRKNYPVFSREEFYEFSKVDDAISFINERKDKMWGVKGSDPNSQTFFSSSNNINLANEELKDFLEKNKDLYEKDGFILEEKIEDLIEFVPEIITYDKEILGINIDIELKHFGAENTGVLTGCSADTIVWIDKEDWGKIILDFFPVEEIYKRDGEMVVWDAGVMYSPSRQAFYFSEFCPRFGYSAIFSELSTFNNVSNFFDKIIHKKELFDGNVSRFGSSIRIFNQNKDENRYIAKDILILAKEDNKNVWLLDAKKINNKIYTGGYDENLAVITFGSDNWMLNFYYIDEAIKNGKAFSFSPAYCRKAKDILDVHYHGNISQRIDFIKKLFKIKSIKNKNFVEIIDNYHTKIKDIEKDVLEISKEKDKYKETIEGLNSIINRYGEFN